MVVFSKLHCCDWLLGLVQFFRGTAINSVFFDCSECQIDLPGYICEQKCKDSTTEYFLRWCLYD